MHNLTCFKKRGDIAVNTAAILLLTIIAVVLFVTVFLVKFPSASKNLYCKTLSPIKVFFLPDSSIVEEKYCKEINELKGNMLKMETVHQRYFYEKSTIKELDFPEGGGTQNFFIQLPKTEVLYAELNVSGFLYQNQTKFSDGEVSEILDFKGTETKQISIILPRNANLISAKMNLSGTKTSTFTNVLVFTGYSSPLTPDCPGTGDAMGDDVRAYLRFHGIKYDETHGWRQNGEEPDWREKFKNHSILFVGCGLELTTTNDDDRTFLKEWIAEGNTLIATCWAINLIVDLFGTGDINYGYTPYISRITPYKQCPESCRCDNLLKACDLVGAQHMCSDSQRIKFTEAAAREYGVNPDEVIEVIYEGSHCFYKTDKSNDDVTILADIVYDPQNPADAEIKYKCADKNNGYPGEAIAEFKYGKGTVLYMAMHIDEQLSNKLGETNFLINAINAYLPKVSNVSITAVNSSMIDWNQTGSLEKPRTATLNINKINKYLEECTTEECTIPINITATQGVLLVNNLLIEYHLPVYNVSINSTGSGILVAENLNDSNSPVTVNKTISEGLNNFLEKCLGSDCFVPLNVTTTSKGRIILSALNVEYKKCLVKEEIVANALACWERANFGKSDKDISCYEISIPESCGAVEDVTEEDITDLLIKNNLCEVLPNNDVNSECGNADKIEWKIMHVASGRNIFIRYSSAEGKIIIS